MELGVIISVVYSTLFSLYNSEGTASLRKFYVWLFVEMMRCGLAVAWPRGMVRVQQVRNFSWNYVAAPESRPLVRCEDTPRTGVLCPEVFGGRTFECCEESMFEWLTWWCLASCASMKSEVKCTRCSYQLHRVCWGPFTHLYGAHMLLRQWAHFFTDPVSDPVFELPRLLPQFSA